MQGGLKDLGLELYLLVAKVVEMMVKYLYGLASI